MGTQITKTSEAHAALAPRTFDEVLRFAEMLAKSDLVPRDYKGKPGNIVAAVQMGAEIGLSPMQALANIAVINGRAAVWGDAMLALVQGHAECEDIIETEGADSFTCTVKRRGRSPVTRTFSVADAKAAQLWGKQGPWQQYSKRMLQMRARAFALRDSFADVLRGIGMAEEVQDIPVREVKGRATVVRERDPAASQGAQPMPALPPHDPSTGEVIDAAYEDEPGDYVITFGKNKDKSLKELPSNSLHWYSTEYRGQDETLKRLARAVLEQRKAEREAAEAAEKAKADADTNGAWGLTGDDATEAELEGEIAEREQFA